MIVCATVRPLTIEGHRLPVGSRVLVDPVGKVIVFNGLRVPVRGSDLRTVTVKRERA